MTEYGTRYVMTPAHGSYYHENHDGIQNPQYGDFFEDREEALERYRHLADAFPDGDIWKAEFVERTAAEPVYTVIPVEPPFKFPTAAGSVVSINGQLFARDIADENQWISLDGNADWLDEDELRGLFGTIRVHFDGKDLNFD